MSAGSIGANPGASVASNRLNLSDGVATHASATPAAASDDDQARKRAFIGVDVDRSTASTQRLEPLTSPYTLQAGSVIAAALVTGKLKLGALVEDKPVKLSIEVPAPVYRDLVAYAAAHGAENGLQHQSPEKLVAPMLAMFMTTDKEFAKARRVASSSEA